MPKVKISEYSTTNSDNTDIESINIAENCPPSGINNAIRELMVHLKEFQTGSSGDPLTVAGSFVASGGATLSGTNTFSGGVIHSGTNTFSSSVIISGNINSSGTTNTFSGGNILSGTNTLSGATIISGNFNATGTTNTFSNALILGNNLTFSGTGNRITGDFSNATVANRVLFQTSTANTFTQVGIIPSGTGTYSVINTYTSSDTTNASFTSMLCLAGLDSRFSADKLGSGTYLPMTFYTNGSESMRIDTSGNVGIGTSSPGQRLVIAQAGDTLAVFNNTSAAYNSYLGCYTNDTRLGNDGSKAITFYTNGTERMRITSGGEVYIAGTTDQGAYNLQCNGTGVWGAGAYVNGSDERIKDDIEPIASGLDVVEKLNPVTYRYKESWSKDQSVQTGFIAQELLTALDGQVYVDGVVQQGGSEGYYSVAYQNIIPILTKAIQELSAKCDAMQAELNQLKGN